MAGFEQVDPLAQSRQVLWRGFLGPLGFSFDQWLFYNCSFCFPQGHTPKGPLLPSDSSTLLRSLSSELAGMERSKWKKLLEAWI